MVPLVRVGWSLIASYSAVAPILVKTLLLRLSLFSVQCSAPLAREHTASSSRPQEHNVKSNNVRLLVSRCTVGGENTMTSVQTQLKI